MSSLRKKLAGKLALAAGLLFPLLAFSQASSYTQIAAGTGNSSELQIIALGNDGLAYLPAWQDTSGTWHTSGQLPGQSRQFKQLVAGTGNSDELQVVGLGTDGHVYLAAWQDTSGTWHASGSELGTGTYSFLAAGVGSAGFLDILGVGASDGKAYLVTHQDANGNWTAYNTAISSVGGLPWLVLGTGIESKMQVVGPVSEQLYLAAFQSNETTFSPAGALPGTTPYIAAATGPGSDGLKVIAVAAGDGLLYAADTQNSSGAWAAGIGKLPGNNVPVSSAVVGSGSGGLQVGGLGLSDGLLHMVAWQNSSGWHAFGSIPTYNVACSQMIPSYDSHGLLNIIGLATNSHIVLVTWQNASGTWTAGADLTPNF